MAALFVIIGMWARSQEQAIATAVIVAIIAGMLGGCVYQLERGEYDGEERGARRAAGVGHGNVLSS